MHLMISTRMSSVQLLLENRDEAENAEKPSCYQGCHQPPVKAVGDVDFAFWLMPQDVSDSAVRDFNGMSLAGVPAL